MQELEPRRLMAGVPAGWVETTITVTGVRQATSMAIAPDGRVFVARQDGTISVVKGDVLLATPAVRLSQVRKEAEGGLLGIALDPKFAFNKYVYVVYSTIDSGDTLGHNRVSRLTVTGDTIDPASEVVLLDLPGFPNGFEHVGGAIEVGADGKLYVAVGNNGPNVDVQAYDVSQRLDNVLGKVLRINRDGSIPTDNPFYDQTTGVNRAIWAYGLRNPYTMAVSPYSGAVYINDVGLDSWEEVNVGAAGANYGWPLSEGPTTAAGETSPVYAYSHNGGGASISGGAFTADGRYYFGDFILGYISLLDVGTGTTDVFAGGYQGLVDVQIGPDGGVYILTYFGKLAKASVVTGPVLTQTPASVVAAIGATATFGVQVDVPTAAAGPAYQWLRDGAAIAGATGVTYSLTAAAADNGARFAVTVTTPSGSVTTPAAVLAVLSADQSAEQAGAPVIVTQPAGVSLATPAEVTFAVGVSAATAAANPTYQWRRNGVNIAGATGAVLTFVAAVADNGAGFDCVVAVGAKSVASATAVLAVLSLEQQQNAIGFPVIATQPASVTAGTFAAVTFAVGVDAVTAGTAVTYQWRRDGIDIVGATAASLVVTPTVADNGARFDCVVANTVGAVVSASAVLAVTALPPTAPVIVQQPASVTVTSLAAVTFGVVAQGAATYQWRRNGVDIAGATAATLAVTPGVGPAAVFDCVVANSVGATLSSPAVLVVNVFAPVIVGQPASVAVASVASVAPVASVAFTVVVDAVTAAAGVTYQWRREGVAIDGATGATLAVTPTTGDVGTRFDCVVTTAGGSVTSAVATLTMTIAPVPVAPVIVTQPGSLLVASLGPVTFVVEATGAATYQWRRNGVAIDGATGATLVVTPSADAPVVLYDCVVGNVVGSTVSATAVLAVSIPPRPVIVGQPAGVTVATLVPVTFAVVVDGVTAGNAPAYQWRREGVAIVGANAASLTVTPTTGDVGTRFDCVVTTVGGSVTSSAAVLTLAVPAPTPPVITAQPVSRAVRRGETVTLAVGAVGAATYQWRRNGVAIAGATGATYAFAAGARDNGTSYEVTATNAVGGTVSSTAVVAVDSNELPTGKIAVSGVPYVQGRAVRFTLTGADVEDRRLANSAFSYRVLFVRGGESTVVVPETVGKKSGAFVAGGVDGADQSYRVELTVTDSGGAQTVVTRELVPKLVTVTVSPGIAGGNVTVNGQIFGGPTTFVSLAGRQQTVSVPREVTGVDGNTYVFKGFSRYSVKPTAVFETPTSNLTLTAKYAKKTG